MSQATMTYEDGMALIEKLRAQNYRAVAIRRELQQHGFSTSEIYEMQGITPYRLEQLKVNAKAKHGEASGGFVLTRPMMIFIGVQLLAIVGAFWYFVYGMVNLLEPQAFRGMTNVYFGELLVFAGVGLPQLFFLNALRQGKHLGVYGLAIMFVLNIIGFGMYEMMDFVALNLVMLIAMIIAVRPSYRHMTGLWH
ncbi:MAG: hypothetical protein AAF846_27045 [Chloroflexota bacterium]